MLIWKSVCRSSTSAISGYDQTTPTQTKNTNMATKKQESTGLMKLLEDQLADMYYVEKQLVKALPKMAKAATNEDLTEAFESHLAETETHVSGLEKIFG